MESTVREGKKINMSDEMTESLEARVAAWVAGEASPFEAAELERLEIEHPELGELRRELAWADRLARESFEPEAEPMRLSPARRAELARNLGINPGKGPRAGKIQPARKQRHWWTRLALPSGLLTGVAVVFFSLVVPLFRHEAPMETQAQPAADGWVNYGAPIPNEVLDAEVSELSEAMPQSLESAQRADVPWRGQTPQEQSIQQMSPPQARPMATPPPAPMAPMPSSAPAEPRRQESLRRSEFVGGEGASGAASSDVRRRSFSDEAPSDIVTEANRESAPGSMVMEGRGEVFAYGISAPQGEVLEENEDALRQFSLLASDRGLALGGSVLEKPVSGSQSLHFFEKTAQDSAVSTFSLYVSDVSFRLTSSALLSERRWPDAELVRPEEFTAAFDYGDPSPAQGQAVSLAQDQAMHAFWPQSRTLRFSVRTAAEGRADQENLQLFVLLDKSGSMERRDRFEGTRAALAALTETLNETDDVTLITFDRETRLVFEGKATELAQVPLLQAQAVHGESGTNLEAALESLSEIVLPRRRDGFQARVILITDGIANLGNQVPMELGEKVSALRQQGVAMDVVAVGARDLGDAVLQELARRGDGRYFLLADGSKASAESFATRIGGALRPAARDVKVQVRFNPARVKQWGLLGFDQHRLQEEDFRDDTVDAAELAAAEQGSAVYQVELLEEGQGEIGEFSIRFFDVATQAVVERRWVIPYQAEAPQLTNASAAHRLAVVATLFAEHLRDSPSGQLVDLALLQELGAKLTADFAGNNQVQLLQQMIDAAVALQ